jgi:uncharacterized membrane protein YhaH (DUF805 family)
MDPNQQQHIQGLIASMGVFFMLFILVIFAFLIFCLWRIFTKAGLAAPLALLVLIPGIGSIVVICILAFARWNVVPVAPQYGALPPGYAPPYPPTYPPTYPPNPPAPPA